MDCPPQEARGWDLSSTCREVNRAGEADGRKVAHSETGAHALARVLSLQARRKFGSKDPAGEALLDALALARDGDRLRRLGVSLLDASGWADWFAGIEPPPPAGDEFPDFAREEEIDLEPEPASIDLTTKISTPSGAMIVHCRLQKWYQPDLGERLYKESRRLEERFKIRPMMVAILLWPSADGPAITGRYRGTDGRGRRVDFRYEVRRAWELEPEAALASPATIMLVPLSKGAKDRMGELIRLTQESLARNQAEGQVVEASWAMFYWSMGMVCSLEEAHALLGDLLPMIQATTVYKQAYGSAFRRGYSQALGEGPILAIRGLVRQQATQRFGGDATHLSALDGVSSLETLKSIAGRIPTARSWSDLFAG